MRSRVGCIAGAAKPLSCSAPPTSQAALLTSMSHRQARVLCFVFAGVFLIAAWWPFMPFPRNQVSWLTGRHGLAFGRPGVAYDPDPLPVPVADSSGKHAPGFAVELSLESGNEPGGNFPHIVTIHDGRTPSIFVIGQWQSELLVRIPAPGRPNRTREAGIHGLRMGEPHVVRQETGVDDGRQRLRSSLAAVPLAGRRRRHTGCSRLPYWRDGAGGSNLCAGDACRRGVRRRGWSGAGSRPSSTPVSCRTA